MERHMSDAGKEKDHATETLLSMKKKNGKICTICGLALILVGLLSVLLSDWLKAAIFLGSGVLLTVAGYKIMTGPIIYYCLYCTHKLGTSVPEKCIHCGKELRPVNDRVYPEDGYCADCGAEIKPSARFCTRCGKDTEE
jgi:hypothetical protein